MRIVVLPVEALTVQEVVLILVRQAAVLIAPAVLEHVKVHVQVLAKGMAVLDVGLAAVKMAVQVVQVYVLDAQDVLDAQAVV